MNEQLKKELNIINNNSKEAQKEIRALLNKDVEVEVKKYMAYVSFNDDDLIRTELEDENKAISSYRIYSMGVNDNTEEDIINNYADFLELASKVMRKEISEKINHILGKYIMKTRDEINNLNLTTI